MSKPTIPKGTRDFVPLQAARRNYIFATARKAFEQYGFLPIETPAMENLATLTGKYGDEGDQLIFKILNNGDFLNKADEKALAEKDSKKLGFSISKKALRYDLTVPFARFVVMNQNELTFPFKRYQIQPVWRGDRPAKGRYQEFFQCDVDVVGSTSLTNEIELIQIFDTVLSNLNLQKFHIKVNNRKILYGIAEKAGIVDKLTAMTVAIDKLDKIGEEGVMKELRSRDISEDSIALIKPLLSIAELDNAGKMAALKTMLEGSEMGQKGIEELNYLLENTAALGLRNGELIVDATLARGLNYYTGAIFEVSVPDATVGSICGGGRYDDLTGIFGLKNMSGVGISFGADRIYDVLTDFDLWPASLETGTDVLFVHFDEAAQFYSIRAAKKLRAAGARVEVYPDLAKMKKQMNYANAKKVQWVCVVGEDEMKQGKYSLKNMETGSQDLVDFEGLAAAISK